MGEADKAPALIGFVASQSGAMTCNILFVEGLEDKVREETFVMVRDGERWILGVVRSGAGFDENLKSEYYS
ncbi:MAG: hypothetical protein QXL52_00445 [Nitrososphaerales archaeon]